MKKTYQKPNAEYISFISSEELTNGILDGSGGVNTGAASGHYPDEE